MAKINAPAAWDVSTGSANVVVGDIDTGIDYTHPDLAPNVWVNPGEVAANGVDDDGNGYVDDVNGWDFVSNDNNPMDDHGHGTHTSGTVGANGNNGVGVVGVNWNVRVAGLKFLNAQGSGSTSNAVLALGYAVAKGMKVTNNSWGGGGFSQALYDAIAKRAQRGHAVRRRGREQQLRQRPAAVLSGVVRPGQRDRGRRDDEHRRPGQLLELRCDERRSRRARRRDHIHGSG